MKWFDWLTLMALIVLLMMCAESVKASDDGPPVRIIEYQGKKLAVPCNVWAQMAYGAGQTGYERYLEITASHYDPRSYEYQVIRDAAGYSSPDTTYPQALVYCVEEANAYWRREAERNGAL